MLLFERPPRPSGFEKRMVPHRQRVDASVETGERPDFQPPAWQSYKAHFARSQHGKCGYCEAPALATGVGDVEHFRPKGEISELDDDPQTWGGERPGLANVKGRKAPPISKLGYWWLAYSWSNWLLACSRCNQAWKGSLFPVEEHPRPELLPGMVDTPLLLSPFGTESPTAHLRFGPLGQVEAVAESRMGFETVRTLGLDREWLRAARAEKAKRIHSLVRRLTTAEGDPLEETLSDILEMGQSKHHYAGMVRIVFEQETGLDWSLLEEPQAEVTEREPPPSAAG